MFRIAICEDNQQETAVVLNLLDSYQKKNAQIMLHVSHFSSGSRLLADLKKGVVFDTFLLDVMMPGMSGMELAKELRLRGMNQPLVFMTAFSDFALEAFRVQATHYLLKPIQEEELFKALDQMIMSIQGDKRNFLIVPTVTGRMKIHYSTIVCVESKLHRLNFHLSNEEKILSKTLRVPFDTAIKSLLEDKRFLHAHKSYVVNMEAVDELTSSAFIMQDGTEVPIPRYKYTLVKQHYLNYLSEVGVGVVGRI